MSRHWIVDKKIKKITNDNFAIVNETLKIHNWNQQIYTKIENNEGIKVGI